MPLPMLLRSLRTNISEITLEAPDETLRGFLLFIDNLDREFVGGAVVRLRESLRIFGILDGMGLTDG